MTWVKWLIIMYQSFGGCKLEFGDGGGNSSYSYCETNVDLLVMTQSQNW